MDKRIQQENEHEKEFTAYSFDGVEENASPLEYFEEEEDALFNEKHQSHLQHSQAYYKKVNTLFSTKEIFDRIGYGLAAHQFINILFFLAGGGVFFVGLIHGVRSALSGLIASFVREYSKYQTISRSFISNSGILFGFSFIALVLAIRLRSPTIFALALLIGSIGVVTYGELYDRLLQEGMKHERKNKFLKRITHWGLLITAGAFFLAGALIEFIGMKGNQITVLGYTFPVTGYFITFELAAIMFIITGFVLSKIPLKTIKPKIHSLKEFIIIYYFEIKEQIKQLFKNKNLALLFIGAILISCVEVLGASYYGYRVYQMFNNTLFGGFFNVAIVFGIAIFASFLGPIITRYFQRKTGLMPMFVFGSMLVAIFPLTLIYNHHFFAVLAAASCSVIGSSILGVAQGLLAKKILTPSTRKLFFHSLEILLVIPFLIIVPLGALVAYFGSFNLLFLLLAGMLVIVIVPLYFTLVVRTQHKRL